MSIKIRLLLLILFFVLIYSTCLICVFAIPNGDIFLSGSINYERPILDLNVKSNMEGEAVVSGTGEYNYGETITISVSTTPAYSTFMAWATSKDAANMSILSTEQTYSFVAAKDSPREIYALFNNNSSVPADVTYNNLIFTTYPESGLAEVKGVVSSTDVSGEVNIPSYFVDNGQSYKVFSIGNSAFQSCSDMTSVVIPDGVTTIEDYGFRWCRALTSINFLGQSSLVKIGQRAFSYCEALAEVALPKNLKSIGNLAFEECRAIKKIYFDSANVSYVLNNKTPFEKSYQVQNIIIGNNVETIPNYFFNALSTVTSLTFEENSKLVEIGEYAFTNCSSILEIILPESVKVLGESCFSNCSKVSTLHIPKALVTLGEKSFYGLKSLETITVADNSVNFATDGYSLISSKGELILYASGNAATSYTIPSEATKILSGAFVFCDNLREITIPDNITKMQSGAFDYSSNVEKVYYNCNITRDFIDSSKTLFGTNFSSNTANLHFVIGENVNVLPENIIKYDTIKHLTILGNIKNFDDDAFPFNNIQGLTIGKNVTSIPSNLFNSSTLSNISNVIVDDGNRNFVVLESEINLGKFALYKIEASGISSSPILDNLDGIKNANVIEKDGAAGYGLYLQINGGAEEIFLKNTDPNSVGGIE